MNNREEGLDYLKGILILSVIFGHVGGYWIFLPYSSYFLIAVPLFFFLSGHFFFMRQRSLDYILKKFIKIYCTYVWFVIVQVTINYFYDSNAIKSDVFIKLLAINNTGSELVMPLGHLWFVKVYLIILSVLYVLSLMRLSLHVHLDKLIICSIVIYIIEYFYVDKFTIFNKVAIYFSFFIFGSYINRIRGLNKKIKAVVVTISMAISIYILMCGYDDQKYLRRIVATIPVIFVFFMFENNLTVVMRKIKASSFLRFCSKNVFELYLLHITGLFFIEQHLIQFLPEKKGIYFGILKFIYVTGLSVVLVISFNTFRSWFRRIREYFFIFNFKKSVKP